MHYLSFVGGLGFLRWGNFQINTRISSYIFIFSSKSVDNNLNYISTYAPFKYGENNLYLIIVKLLLTAANSDHSYYTGKLVCLVCLVLSGIATNPPLLYRKAGMSGIAANPDLPNYKEKLVCLGIAGNPISHILPESWYVWYSHEPSLIMKES